MIKMSEPKRIIKGYAFVIFPIIFDLDKDTSNWDTNCWQWKKLKWLLEFIWKISGHPKYSCPGVRFWDFIDFDTQREIMHIIKKNQLEEL
jgi:hypothetical protein